MMLRLLVLIFTTIVGSLGSNFEPCPSGWQSLSTSKTTTCLYTSHFYTHHTMESAHQDCVNKNSSLVIIDSEEKLDKLQNEYGIPSGGIWIGLKKNDSELYWQTQDGLIPAENIPFNINWQDYSNLAQFTLTNGKLEITTYDYPFYYFICEQQPDCAKGWFGPGCRRECHCHDEECDPKAQELKCSFGCEVGWMGDDCSMKKEDADVRYFCVNSDDQGKYAHVIIDTKGVQYDNINPVNGDGDWISWCNNTVVYYTGNDPSATHVKIYIDNSTNGNMNDGVCAGQITITGFYEWKIKIQEHDGLVSRNDQEVSIECQFSEGDKFTLTGETEIKRESLFSKFDINRPMKYLEEKKEEVKLELIDPSTGEPVTELILGSPVAIRITFGLHEDNIATGVRPFNCKATSPNEKHNAQFLDKKGCSVSGFPISAFYKSGPKTLMTKTFPLFGFDDTKEVEFHCAYTLCFGNTNCQKDCGVDDDDKGRSRRSINEESLSIKNTVKIL